MKRLNWTPQEDDIISELFPTLSSKKWKKLSEAMRHHGFLRTQGECRERWVNYLDPRLKNSDWSEAELTQLYTLHADIGTKWAEIQKRMGRSQNTLKNRFYGTLRNYLRCVLTTLGPKPYHATIEISKLSPKWLNDFYNGSGEFAFMGSEVKDTIREMGYMVNKVHLAPILKQKEEMYQEVKKMTLGEFKVQDIVFRGQPGRPSSKKVEAVTMPVNKKQETPPEKVQSENGLEGAKTTQGQSGTGEVMVPVAQYPSKMPCFEVATPFTMGGYQGFSPFQSNVFSNVSLSWPMFWQGQY